MASRLSNSGQDVYPMISYDAWPLKWLNNLIMNSLRQLLLAESILSLLSQDKGKLSSILVAHEHRKRSADVVEHPGSPEMHTQ
jgi:hypothetical protein